MSAPVNGQNNDQIVRYVKTIRDGLESFCTACGGVRHVFMGETAGGDTITCCCVCQRVLARLRTATGPKADAAHTISISPSRGSAVSPSTISPESLGPMSDEKMERDTRKKFSQMDIDAATKPLHAEIERLKAMRAENPWSATTPDPSVVAPAFVASAPPNGRWVPERVPVPLFDEPGPTDADRFIGWLKSWVRRLFASGVEKPELSEEVAHRLALEWLKRDLAAAIEAFRRRTGKAPVAISFTVKEILEQEQPIA